jgi:alpha-glucosidase
MKREATRDTNTTSIPMKNTVIALVWLIGTASLHSQPLSVKSPDGNLEFRIAVENAAEEKGCLFYELSYKGKTVILKSRLGIVTVDLPHWTAGFNLTGHSLRTVNETWKPVYGERSTVANRYNECTVNLVQGGDTARTFQLFIRVYNEGAAFCYNFPENLSTSVLHIKDEKTEFAFDEGAIAYVTPFAQELYHARPLRDWSYGSNPPLPAWSPRTPDYESERPLTLVLPIGLFVAIGEAHLVNYSRMKFVLAPGKKNTVAARLFGPVTESSPFTTPWRVIMVAEQAGGLIEHNDIFLNLNPPCEIRNTEWIRPGKVMREVTLSTAGAKECVDFCAKHKIQYIEFDAGWYGYEYSKAADASKVDVDPRRNPTKDLDLQKAVAYARENNIGVILYVNHRALEKQIDEILPLYREWGIAGLKFGLSTSVHTDGQPGSTMLSGRRRCITSWSISMTNTGPPASVGHIQT